VAAAVTVAGAAVCVGAVYTGHVVSNMVTKGESPGEAVKDANKELADTGAAVVSLAKKAVDSVKSVLDSLNLMKAKDRKDKEKAESTEKKHGDSAWQEPASEDYAKWKAQEKEKSAGKDARREAHDEKQAGEADRSKRRIDDDYK
jgi:hypothetical protein